MVNRLMKISKKILTGFTAAAIFTSTIPFNVYADDVKSTQYEYFKQHLGQDELKISQIAQYNSGVGAGGTEILSYDSATKKAFVTNGAVSGFDILSFDELESGKFTKVKSQKRVVLSEFNIDHVSDITSIAVHPTKDLVAVSAVHKDKTKPGFIVFVNKEGEYVAHVEVGSLPDMVTFTPDGTKALVANEGEPADNYYVDPEGSIAIIDVTGEPSTFKAKQLNFTEDLLDENVRVSSVGTVQQQLEPEYITVSDDSKYAYVSLQENNAIATVDLQEEKIISVKGLGVKDHSVPGNEIDPSNKDGINIAKQPIKAFYMPDAIDTFTVNGKTYILTPNEGDARDYDAYSEEGEVGEDLIENGLLDLKAEHYEGYTQEELDALQNDPTALKTLSKYKITLENGKNAETGKYEAIYGYGGRSFSIFDAETMELVYDSGSEFERITAEFEGGKYFNIDNEEVTMDDRSDNKGPEPETVVHGEINGKTYAFIALERFSGIMVYDLSNPTHPEFVSLITSRNFDLTEYDGKVADESAGDISPEGLQFIPAEESPTGQPLLAATHEVSGTVAVYEFKVPGEEPTNPQPEQPEEPEEPKQPADEEDQQNDGQQDKDNQQVGSDNQDKDDQQNDKDNQEGKTKDENNKGKKFVVVAEKQGDFYTINGELAGKAEVVIEVPNKNNATLKLTEEQVKALANDAIVKVTNGVAEVDLVASELGDSEAVISLKKVKVDGKAAYVAYDFNIKVAGKEVTDFDEDLTLTFTLEKDQVKDAEKVKVYYYNEKTKKWELVGGTYNNETNSISATTDHLSVFGVFEGDATGTPEKTLPNTATNVFNSLVAGVAMIGAAVGAFFINRRKKA